MEYPSRIGSLILGKEQFSDSFFEKKNPATGDKLSSVSIATEDMIHEAVSNTVNAHKNWDKISLEERARILRKAAELIQERKDEIVSLVATETGRSKKNTVGEIAGAAKGGLYLLEHLEELAPEQIESAEQKRKVTLMRTSVGAGVLITPFNSPFVLLTGKLFPALLCGNTVVVKAHELSPLTPIIIAKIFFEAGVPKDAISVLQGGREVGATLVADPRISFVSFTGSSVGATAIITATASRIAQVSIEAGGKNPFVVCDDADIPNAVRQAVASAFVDAGQRCAAASRIIVTEGVYEKFRTMFLEAVRALKVGVNDTDDYGAIISEKRIEELVARLGEAEACGATFLLRGSVLPGDGYFLTPTVLENVSPDNPLSQEELFGPIVILYRARDFDEAIAIANNSSYRLASAIHTKDIEKAERFAREHGAGVTRINGPTFGSEPHMPFGGEGLSGNGWREPGVEAFNFYSSLKQVSVDQL